MGQAMLPAAVIEFLIPVTILLAAAANLRRGPVAPTGRSAAVAGCFGLVHGAGFANYLASLFEGPVALPLFGFNLGIELGQLAIIVAGLGGFALLDRIITPRSRAMLASVAAGSWALVVAVERAPR